MIDQSAKTNYYSFLLSNDCNLRLLSYGNQLISPPMLCIINTLMFWIVE